MTIHPHSDPSDSTAPMRAGEELPLDRLTDYLQQKLPAVTGELVVEQFPHGNSNLTYLLRMGATEMVLRRPPFGNQVVSAHDMGREFRVLSQLHPVFPSAPQPWFFCEEETVIGAPFYVMERRRGMVLRKSLPPGLVIDAGLAQRLSTALVDHLAALHSVDYQAAGLQGLGKPQGYVARQVAGWSRRYTQAQTSIVPEMDRVSARLTDRQPSESAASVIHNDYKYDNVMLDEHDPTRITTVLDWEMATIGDPLMDLGTTLGYWVEAGDPQPLQQEAAFGPTALPGSLTRREIIDRYEERTGIAVSRPEFYYAFGLFKIAVIVQQIYARFVRGHTSDRRFAQMDQLVLLLAQQANRVLDTGRISDV